MAPARVALVARFPVKSMGGETVESIEVGRRGLVGDRAWAVIDRRDGKVASAKHPRKWAALLQCQAGFVEPPGDEAVLPPVEIRFPDGSSCRTDQPRASELVSSFVGREVTLASVAPEDRRFEEIWPDIDGLAPQTFIDSTTVGREESGEPVSELALGLASPPGTFFDVSLVHLMSTATLEELRRRTPSCDFDWRRYRPNILIEMDGPGFPENDWPGQNLRLGSAVLSVSMSTMRCVMTTLAQPGLTSDRDTLRAIAAANRVDIPGLGVWACAGVYADVVEAGRVSVGDPVTVG